VTDEQVDRLIAALERIGATVERLVPTPVEKLQAQPVGQTFTACVDEPAGGAPKHAVPLRPDAPVASAGIGGYTSQSPLPARVMDTPGSSKLTDEQADFYAGRFGERYTTVQEQPLRPSRRVRRAKNGKRAARGPLERRPRCPRPAGGRAPAARAVADPTDALMPFVSKAQRRKFHATPSLQQYIPEFEAATKGPLPERVGRPTKHPQAHGALAQMLAAGGNHHRGGRR
jgi:hypothetical protein